MSATRIEIPTDDGVAPAFAFGAPASPPVLLLSDGIGMRPAMHEMAERLAAAGYHVLVPDLFYRLGPYTPPDPRVLFSDPETRAAWARRLGANTADKLLGDIRAYLGHLGDAPCGVTGYCMGGRLALLAAATFPDRIAAAAAYHPGGLVSDAPDSPHHRLGRIRARVYIGAASDDPSFTDEQRAIVEQALAAAGVDHVMELYAARHGFVPSDTPVHDAAAAERHWETLLALLRSTLPRA
jgi:carboxymethylenebutenolidase